MESDNNQLVSLLKFVTGHSLITSLINLIIKLELLGEDKSLKLKPVSQHYCLLSMKIKPLKSMRLLV